MSNAAERYAASSGIMCLNLRMVERHSTQPMSGCCVAPVTRPRRIARSCDAGPWRFRLPLALSPERGRHHHISQPNTSCVWCMGGEGKSSPGHRGLTAPVPRVKKIFAKDRKTAKWTPEMTRKTAEQWAEIEAVYRSGVLRNGGIARKFGISESTLRSRIKSGGWIVEEREKTAKKGQTAKKPRKPRNGRPDTAGTQKDHAPEDLRAKIQEEISNTLRALADADDQETIRALKAKSDSLKALAQTFEITVGKGSDPSQKKGVKEVRQEEAEALVSNGTFSPMKPPESFSYVRTKRKETQH